MELNIRLTDNDFTPKNERTRSLAMFLMLAIGDLNDIREEELPKYPVFGVHSETIPEAPKAPGVVHSPVPPPPPPPPQPDIEEDDEDDGDSPSNIVNFPIPVPPPPSSGVTTAAAPIATGTHVLTGQLDSARMPFDARIHSKIGSKKKDGTWKLTKGIDKDYARKIVMEIAGQQPAAPVPLPPTGENPVLLPPIPPPPSAIAPVPAPPVSIFVPVPPPPSDGTVAKSASEYRALIDQIGEFSLMGKLNATQVVQACHKHGVANLQEVAKNPQLISAIRTEINMMILLGAG
jgi:hypothetical protein